MQLISSSISYEEQTVDEMQAGERRTVISVVHWSFDNTWTVDVVRQSLVGWRGKRCECCGIAPAPWYILRHWKRFTIKAEDVSRLSQLIQRRVDDDDSGNTTLRLNFATSGWAASWPTKSGGE